VAREADLAAAVAEVAEEPSQFAFLYPDDATPRALVGGGFIYPICGDMRSTMPGLSASPAATRIDIDSRGEIVGLS
jgi:formyltetrahydrofolate synthetase